MNARTALLLGAVLTVSCRGGHAPTPSPSASASASASTSATGGKAGKGLAEPDDDPIFRPEPPEEAPLELGPAPTAEERELRLQQLLQGFTPASRFPTLATDRGADFDAGQFMRLTTVAAGGGGRGLGDLDKAPQVTAEVAEPQVITGRPDLAQLRRVVKGMRAGFRNCFKRLLDNSSDKPARTAELDVIVSVKREDGEDVPHASFKSLPASQTLGVCIRSRIEASALDPQPEPLTYRFSIKLRWDEK